MTNIVKANLIYYEQRVDNIGNMYQDKHRIPGKLNLNSGEFILNKFSIFRESQVELKFNDELHVFDLKFVSGKYFADKNNNILANFTLAHKLKNNLAPTFTVKKKKI